VEVLKLTLKDFRNYPEAIAEFGPGSNAVIGPNGHGKTNLIEAIHVLSTATSHRASLASVVRRGESIALLHAQGLVNNRSIQVSAEIAESGRSKFLVNGSPLERTHEAGRTLGCVLFSPDDLALVKGGPEERRRFLDETVAASKPLGVAERLQFERTLKQRNSVLKAAQFNQRAAQQLDVWTDQLASTGAKLVRNRLVAIDQIAPLAKQWYRHLAQKQVDLEISYQPSWCEAEAPRSLTDITATLISMWTGMKNKDLERGLTLAGPHRDEIGIRLGGAPAKIFASQGEQRSIALSLRLAERDMAAEALQEPPILLLDDVFSELDALRRSMVVELMQNAGQTIATATSTEGLPFEPERILEVKEGALVGR